MPTESSPGKPADDPGPPAGDADAAEAVLSRYVRDRVAPHLPAVERAVARKVRPEHIDRMLQYLTLREQNRHAEVRQKVWLGPALAAAVTLGILVFVFSFAWLAFSYGKAELVLPIVTGVIGAVGGYGFGKAQAKKGDPTNPPPPM